MNSHWTLVAMLLLASSLFAQTIYYPSKLPKGHDYFELRDGIANAHRKFEQEKTGRVAFLGGSITAGGGWRDHAIKYFQANFPHTKFDFVAAGVEPPLSPALRWGGCGGCEKANPYQ